MINNSLNKIKNNQNKTKFSVTYFSCIVNQKPL